MNDLTSKTRPTRRILSIESRLLVMHVVGYSIVFIANFFTSVKIFGLGWSTTPTSFTHEFIVVAFITLISGIVAAVPTRSDWKIVAPCSLIGPGLVSGLMAQGILQNGAFHLFHWIFIPISGSLISIVSFMATKQLLRRRR